jgi:hypothetical protein
VGSRPSVANVERIIQKNGFSFERYFRKELNTKESWFDWEPLFTGNCSRLVDENYVWLRRAWFCSK